uniref:Zgc:153901 n=1 Tax=Cyprinus carpio TaxID=7962 RepID=A0A8C1KJS1_CYPCA
RSAFTDTHGKKCSGITVLNIFIDIDYSRSVTLLLHAVLSACERACSLIDMNVHEGIHPCMGAVDLVHSIHWGRRWALKIVEKRPRVCGHFGWADSPQHRVPAKRRKAIGWFKKVLDMSAIQPDVGPQPTRRYGITGYFLKSTVTKYRTKIKHQEYMLKIKFFNLKKSCFLISKFQVFALFVICQRLAEGALSNGIGECWKELQHVHM